jgi:hypothetical protein
MLYSLSEAADVCGLNALGNGAHHLASGRPGGSAAPTVLDRTRMPVGRGRPQRPVRPNLRAACECCSLDERDAIFDALRPLVEQGWQIDVTYSFDHQLTPRHITLHGWLGLTLIATRGLYGTDRQSIENQEAARLAHLPDRATAAELNKRKIATAAGGRWYPQTVARVRARLASYRNRAWNFSFHATVMR